MKTEIDIKKDLYQQACKEAALQNCTVQEWMASAIARQLQQTDNLRDFIAEQSKGASRRKAIAGLDAISKAVNLPPVPGDEMPEEAA